MLFNNYFYFMKIIINSSALQERASQLVQKIAPYFFY